MPAIAHSSREKTHEIAPETNSTLGGAQPAGIVTVMTARNCATVSHAKSSAKNLPGHTLYTRLTSEHLQRIYAHCQKREKKNTPSAEAEDVSARVVRAAVEGAIFGKVPLGLERERVWVQCGVVRDTPHVAHHDRPLREVVPAVHIILSEQERDPCQATHSVRILLALESVSRERQRTSGHGWVPPQDLLHDRGYIRQAVAVSEVGQAMRTDNAVDLLLGTRLYLRVECNHEQEYLTANDCLDIQIQD